MGAGVLVCFIGLIATYFVCLNRSMDKFKQMGKPFAKFRFTNELVELESDIGKTELAWKVIEEIWEYPSVWLVFVSKQSYITLPTDDVSEELKQFINLKIKESRHQEQITN